MSVVGAVALVRAQAPAELAHRYQHHAIEAIVQVGVEGAERTAELARKAGEPRRLVLMRVPATHVDGEGTDAEIHADHAGDRREAAADLGLLVDRAAARLIRRHLAVGLAQAAVDQGDALQRAARGDIESGPDR